MKFKPGERLRAVREARDLSMGKLAEMAEVDKGQISRFESGDRPQMSVEQLAKIVAVLRAPLDWIWFGEEAASIFEGFHPPYPVKSEIEDDPIVKLVGARGLSEAPPRPTVESVSPPIRVTKRKRP